MNILETYLKTGEIPEKKEISPEDFIVLNKKIHEIEKKIKEFFSFLNYQLEPIAHHSFLIKKGDKLLINVVYTEFRASNYVRVTVQVF